MQIQKVEIYDAEAVVMTLVGDFSDCLTNAALGARLLRLNGAQSVASSGARTPEAFLIAANSTCLRIGLDGLCQAQVARYAEHVSTVFPEAVSGSFETGHPSKVDGLGGEYAWCGDCTITREDGTQLLVDRFQIKRSCVTVAEFLEFTQSTGYLTDAEKEDDWGGTFATNTIVESDDRKVTERYPVVQVSFNDALAYTDWAQCSLPTEDQWLAAAVVDWGGDTAGPRQVAACVGRQHLEFGNAEWVRSPDENCDEAVYRVGPVGVLKPDWRQQSNRHTAPKACRTLVLSFRTVA